jgi:glycosyltransferase involved in cell wall biosynthesis
VKILLVNKYWYIRGGAERIVFATKKVLEDAGHTVEVFGMHHEKNILSRPFFAEYIDYKETNIIKKLKYSFRFIYNRQAKKQFEQVVKDFKPDVVHMHNIYHQLSFSLLSVTKKYKIKTMMTLHDYKLLHPNYSLFKDGQILKPMTKSYWKCLFRPCYESRLKNILVICEAYVRKWLKLVDSIDYFLCPSQWMYDLMGKHGYATDKLVYVPNVVEKSKVKRVKRTDTVLYFGRFSKEKGIDILLEAAKQTPDISYICIGTGPMKKEIQQKIDEEEIRNVELKSWMDKEKLNIYIAQARIVVVPSIWYENAPLSILEALDMGKIVIGTNIGGIPELLSSKFTVRINDASALATRIEEWYNKSEEERKKEEVKIKRKAQKFSEKKYLANLEGIYKNM